MFCSLSSTHSVHISLQDLVFHGLFFHLGSEIIFTANFCPLCRDLTRSLGGYKASSEIEKPQRTVTKHLSAQIRNQLKKGRHPIQAGHTDFPWLKNLPGKELHWENHPVSPRHLFLGRMNHLLEAPLFTGYQQSPD